MEHQDCDGIAWVSHVDTKSKCDVLIVGEDDFIDLEAEENLTFPFYGEGKELQGEIEEVQAMLLGGPSHKKAPPTASPTPHRQNNSRKKREKKAACLSHSNQRVEEIEQDNERLVERLRAVALSPPKAQSVAREHDRVRVTACETQPSTTFFHLQRKEI